jgi:glycosyltransferase involved in cell wall biosynthesis
MTGTDASQAPAEFRICGLVPLFNNGDTVAGVVAALRVHVPTVIVVDDGSTDGGPSHLATHPDLRGLILVLHDRNRGKGAAVQTGVVRARALGFTHVLQMDADAQHDAADIPTFLAASHADPRAVLAGERIFDENAPGSSRFGRKFGMFWYDLETRHHPLTDTQCGYRVYPLALFDALPAMGPRMEFDVEVLVRAVWAGFPVRGIPTHVRYGRPGEHRSHFRPFRDNVRMTWLHTRLSLGALFRSLPGGRRWGTVV